MEILGKIRAGEILINHISEISRASKDGTLDRDIAEGIIKLPVFVDWNRVDDLHVPYPKYMRSRLPCAQHCLDYGQSSLHQVIANGAPESTVGGLREPIQKLKDIQKTTVS